MTTQAASESQARATSEDRIAALIREAAKRHAIDAQIREAAGRLVASFGCNDNADAVRQVEERMREIRSLLIQGEQASDSKPQEPRQQYEKQGCDEPLLRHELTLRHVYAAHALTGLLASSATIGDEDVAQMAWRTADAMMQELANRRVRGLHN